jgi:hypothetical protein
MESIWMSKEPLLRNPTEVIALQRLLARLPDYLENSWQIVAADSGYFGDGSSGENGIRSNSNLVFAIAVLLAQRKEIGISEAVCAKLTTKLRQLVRYLTNSHVTGYGTCADNGRWGLNWQSSWWATKLALGSDIARDLLESSDVMAVHALVTAEANRHLDRLIPTGLAEDTKAEETAWDAEILAVALALLPKNANAPSWRRRLIEFGINTFSRPSDRDNDTNVDGVVVCDALRSCNIHEDGSLENHGTTHFCYVASPLISKTWCGYALRRASRPVPTALSHNVAHVWRFAEPTFLTNRFAYLGGQDWARYTYGEYFILPALPFLASIGCGRRTGSIFRQRLKLIEMEAAQSSDGSFFGARFTQGRYNGQYAKYETDCFACIALSLEMLTSHGLGIGPTEELPRPVVLSSPEALCCYARDSDLFMSFAWSTLTRSVPNVTFLPLSDDSLAEWHEANLLGSVKFAQPVKWVGVKAMEACENGLRVEGTHSIRNLKGAALAEHELSLELKAGVLRLLSRYTCGNKLRAAHLTGLNWRIPNDAFNKFRRLYFFEGPDTAISSYESVAPKGGATLKSLSRLQKVRQKLKKYGEVVPLGTSSWLNVDNKVGLVFQGKKEFVLRLYPLKDAPWNSLNVEQVESPEAHWRFNVLEGKVLLEMNCLLHLGTAEETLELSRNC